MEVESCPASSIRLLGFASAIASRGISGRGVRSTDAAVGSRVMGRTMTVRRLLVLPCLCAALLPGLACKGEEKTAADMPRLTAGEAKNVAGAKAALRRMATTGRFSGAVLIANRGKVLFSRAYGLADRERRIPNTLDTRFRIGSMNKMFTAVAILQ